MATKPKVGQIKSTAPRFEFLEDDGAQFEGARFYDQAAPAAPAPIQKTGMARTFGDQALALGQGVIGGVKMLSDLAGPDNAVSQTLGRVSGGMQEMYSSARTAEMKNRQSLIEAADASGSTVDQITSRLGGIGEAPMQTLLQAAGSMAPNIAAAVATGGLSTGPGLAALAARIGVPAVLGIGMGVGSVKGQNYEAVFQKAKQEGQSDDQATELAIKASEYSAQNAPQQAVGGALGVLDSLTGAERFISGMARKGVSAEPAKGLIRRTVSGGVEEAIPEGFQGAQGQYAQNEALNNSGFEVDPWAGVAGQGVNDAVVGAMVGAPLGAANGRQATQPAAPELPPTPPPGPMTRAANLARNDDITDLTLKESSSPIERTNEQDLADLVDSERRDLQVMQAQMAQDQAKQAEIDAAFEAKPELDATTAAVQRAATVDAPNAMQSAFDRLADNTIGAEPEAPVVPPTEARIVPRAPDMKPMPKELAELQVDMDGGEVARVKNQNGKFGYVVVPKPAPPVQKPVTAATVKTTSTAQDGDILNKLGNPFTNLFSAKTEAGKQGAGFEPVKLNEKAYVVRKAALVPGIAMPDNAQPPASNEPAGLVPLAGGDAGAVAPTGEQSQLTTTSPTRTPVAGQISTPATLKKVSKKDATEIFSGMAKSEADARIAPEKTAFSDFLASSKETIFQDLLNKRANKDLLSEAQEDQFFDLRRERQDAVIASDNYGKLQKLEAPVAGQTPAPADQAEAQLAVAPADNHIGRNNQPLSEGGKPFRNKADATKARKTQPMLRVVKSGKGFALAPKSEMQLAAEEKASKRLSNPQTSPAGEPIPAHSFIANEGGMSGKTKNEFRMGINPKIGNRNLFAGKGTGMTVERATARLIEEGYLPQGASHSDAIAMIKRSLTQPQYTPTGTETMAQAGMEAQYEDYLAAQQEAAQAETFDPVASMGSHDFIEDDLTGTGYAQATPEIQREVEALAAQLEAMGIDAEEIQMDIASQFPQVTNQEHYELTKTAITQAIEGQDAITRGRSNNGANVDQQGQPIESAAEVLTAPVEQIRVADLSRATTERLAAAYRGKAYKGVSEDYQTLRSDLEARAGDVNFKDRSLAQEVLERFDDSLANKALKENTEGLTAPTRQEVLDQQDRADNAAALDDKAQVDREAAGQTLTRQTAPEQRRDTSGDMFPMEKATAEIDRRNAGQAANTDPNQDAMFSRSATNESIPEKNALKALSENDELFALPKSNKETIEGIAAEIDPGITVKKLNHPGLVQTYVLTMPDGGRAKMMVRPVNPYGPQTYGSIDHGDGKIETLTERPGDNAESVPDDIENVYIDVSALKEGGQGARIYNIAATLAHNTGRILIGDPAGLSDVAMRRRTENMLSSALKFGTTSHIAPHPRQIEGVSGIGVPPLQWTYGDDLGNIRSLIQTSLESLDHAGANLLTFDIPTGTFRDSEGRVLDDSAIRQIVESRRRPANRAGITTYKRGAILGALVREEGTKGSTGGKGAGILAQLVDVGREFPASSKGIFYNRGIDGTAGLPASKVQATVDAIKARWSNAPRVVVADNMADPRIPQAARDENSKQQSQGATGNPDGFIHEGVVYLVADQLATTDDVARVLLHEALGHAGLRGVFGDKLKPILQQLATMRKAEVAAKAKQYGLDMNKEADRLQAAEEVLAEMAQSRPEIGFVKRAIAIIRGWLRDNVPGFANMKLTDADIIAQFILPARAYIERGKGGPGGGVALSRGAAGQTATAAFKKWFGDSKVVDAKGNPLVVYRGVTKDTGGIVRTATGGYFTKDAEYASTYASSQYTTDERNPNVMPVFLNLRNPKVLKNPGFWKMLRHGFDSSKARSSEASFAMYLTPEMISKYKSEGYDGIINEPWNEIIAFDSTQVKSAIGNNGGFDRTNPDIRFSRTKIVGQTSRQYTPEQLRGMANVGFQVEVPTLKERAQALWKDAGKKMAQGIVDQFAPVKDLSKEAYGLLRLSKGSSGAFEALLHGGKLKLTDNVYDIDADNRGGVVETLLQPMQGEHHDALRWVAANRAERLMNDSEATRAEGQKLLAEAVQLDADARALDNQAKQYLQQAGNFPKSMTGNQLAQKANAVEANKLMAQAKKVRDAAADKRKDGNEKKNVSRENLFTREDIAALKTLTDGETGFDYTIQNGTKKGIVTRDRALIYKDFNDNLSGFNKNILDMAEQSGLIDPESRKLWEHEFYVPFYRVADEDGGGVRGMSVKGSVLRQQAFKELKGGKNALNSDLLDNTLMNWAHLLDASAKNRAAKATIEAAERMGVAMGGNQATLAQMGASIHNKNGVVWFMDGGQKRYSLIDKEGDGPYLMTALGALEYAGMRNPMMNAMGAFKHALTIGVTASPFFKVRNLIRDSVSVIGTSSINKNGFANVTQGWKLTDPKSDAYFRLLAGGGTIHFGTMLEGSESKRIQALVESGVKDSTILNDQNKVKAFYRQWIEPGIAAYNELGNRGEAVNRAALYDQLVKGGMNHADASLQARDLMDFSMQGSFTSIRFLTQVVPFLNARLQGLYKLRRSAKDNPARLAAVLGATALFSVALLAAYSDDDDWKQREEWDRNGFWWFKFGGEAFRIPKPFEIGALGTLAERGFELAFDKEMTGTRFRNQVMTLLGDNLAMNPVPQMVKPILDVYANKNSFTNRPIESMSMERLKPEYRFNDRTSMVARGLSTAANSVTNLVGMDSPSPVQIDSMLRGYFGWLGSFVVGIADIPARLATSQPGQATPDYWKTATGGIVSDLRDAPSRYVSQMYAQSREIEQAYGTWRALQKEGKGQEAAEFAQDNQDKLSKYRMVENAKKQASSANQRIRMIERSDMDGDKKRELIRGVQEQKDRAARAIAA